MFGETFAGMLDTAAVDVKSLAAVVDKSIFEVGTATLATAIVLFLTLTLIPIQQCAATYSPSLLKYLKRDRIVIALMLFLITSLFFNICMLLIEPDTTFALISAIILGLSFVCIILVWYRITRMLDPGEYLLPRIAEDAIKRLRRSLKRTRGLTDEEQLLQLEHQMKKAVMVGEKIDPLHDKWAVSPEATKHLIDQVRPLKSTIMKLVVASDYETFEKAVDIVGNVSEQYFTLRKDYKNPDDEFLFWLCEAFQDLIRAARQSSNVYFSRRLFDTIMKVAASTVPVKAYGYTRGRNDLTHALSGLLRDAALASVLISDRDRGYDAVKNLGYTAETLSSSGFSIGATEIVSELVQVAKLCHEAKETIVPVPIRRSLAEIFFRVMYAKRLPPLYEVPYDKLLETYEVFISMPLGAAIDLTEGESLFGWNPDLMRDRSLSAFVYASLFSPNHDDDSINHNLDGVSRIIGFLEKHHDANLNTGWRFTHLLYQIALWLFAFADKDIQMELTLLPAGRIPTEANQKKAKEILVELIKYCLIDYFRCVNRERKHILGMADVLHAPLSLLYLALHWNEEHSLNLNRHIESLLELLEELLQSVKRRIDYEAYRSFQLLCQFLKRKGEESRANAIQGKAQAAWNGRYDASGLHMLNIIKRPIVTFNYKFISKLDTEIFGGKDD